MNRKKLALSYSQPLQSSAPEMTVEIENLVLSGVISEIFVLEVNYKIWD